MPLEGVGSSSTGVTDNCELSDMGAGKRTACGFTTELSPQPVFKTLAILE